MLSEEEKKAIEILKNFNDDFTFKECEVCFNYNEQDCCCNKEKCDNLKATDTLLNLITKLQKENEELKSKNKYLKLENNAYGNEIVKQDVEIKEKDRYIKNSEDITTEMNNDINKMLLELQQKDKQINLMAEWIFDKDYGKNSLLIHRDDYYSNCIKQVRQYFETKAKKGE